MTDNIRIDKYLWAIRVFKTRSDASEACNGGKVRINGNSAKASKAVRCGDMIEIRKGPANLSYRVLQLTESRMGAQLVPSYAENLTPESEMEKFHAPVQTLILKRDRGAGRPTKKERRTIDALLDSLEEG